MTVAYKKITDNPAYNVWRMMKQRCCNPNYNQYADYGGRGITVCARWESSFTNFLTDVGPRPAGAKLERKDNNAGYTKANCCWVTHKQQMRNRRNSRLITFDGETHCVGEWAEIVGISEHTLWCRLFQYHWSVKRALTRPLDLSQRRHVRK